MRIAVLLGGIAYESQMLLLSGITEYASKNNIDIFVFTCNGDNYRHTEYGIGEFQIYGLPVLEEYDGIIIAQNTIQDEAVAAGLMEKISQTPVPAVSIEAKLGGKCTFYVDNAKAMEDMISHLIERHNVGRIAYLSGPQGNQESNSRLEGVMNGLKKYGRVLEDKDITYGNYWIDSGARLIQKLCDSDTGLPDAVVCANDSMAIGVYTELRKRGYTPGKDVMVTGFDHAADTDRLFPKITTLEKPLREMGYEACKSLAMNQPMHNREFRINGCYRGSCGCDEQEEMTLAELRLSMVEQRFEMLSFADINKNTASDLNDCDSFERFYEVLKKYIRMMDFTHFYVCLCENDMADNETEYRHTLRENYSDRIYIPVAWENGHFTEYGFFARKELLPQECLDSLCGHTAIVMPLHFRKNCLGYCVMSGSIMPTKDTLFQNWISNISNALENIRKQQELKRLVDCLDKAWIMDSMTQVYNRVGFYRFAEPLIKECIEEQRMVWILFADINKLKTVNDYYGHEEGDYYIKVCAQALKELNIPGAVLMRYGGDEFVLLAKGRHSDDTEDKPSEVIDLCLNKYLRECKNRDNKDYEMSVSVGIHEAEIDTEFKLDAIIELADQEMYKMKVERGIGR